MALKVGELFASFKIDSSTVEGSLSNIKKRCEDLGGSFTSLGKKMSLLVTAPIVKAGKEMLQTGMEFEKQMSDVFAKSGLDSAIEADVELMNQLTAKALEMGSTTEWTATQAGEALSYMAMAGWDVDSMLAGLPSVMNLATASGENLATTSDIVTDAMTAMGLTMEAAGGDTNVFTGYVEHFSDVLAAAATNSNTNVSLMGESFKYAAPLAGSLGYSIDDLALALGLMANNGIKGSMSGTSLRNVIQHMIDPTDAQAEAMQKLGLSLYDAKGNVKSLGDQMEDWRAAAKNADTDLAALQAKITELDKKHEIGEISDAEYNASIERLVGSNDNFLQSVVQLTGARGLSGFLAIVNTSDDEFNALKSSIEECDGATEKMAKTMLDNTQGSITLFKSALDGLSVTIFNLYNSDMRGLVDKLTEMVQNFQALDPEMLKMITNATGITAALGPMMVLIGTVIKKLPKLISLVTSLASPMSIITSALMLFSVAAIDKNNDLGKTFELISSKAADGLDKLNQTLPDKLGDTSERMGTLAESIQKGVEALLPELTDTIGIVIVGFLDAVSANAGGIMDIGLAVIQGIVDGLTKNLPDMLPALVDALVAVFGALIEAVPSLLSSGIDLVSAIIDGLANIDWATNASALASSLSSAFEKVIGLLLNVDYAGMASTLGTIASNLVTALLDAIKQLFSNISSDDGEAIGEAITEIIEGAFAIVSALIPALVDIGGAIVNLLLDPQTYVAIFEAAKVLGKAIAKGVMNGVADLGISLAQALYGEAVDAEGNPTTKNDVVNRLLGLGNPDLAREGVEEFNQILSDANKTLDSQSTQWTAFNTKTGKGRYLTYAEAISKGYTTYADIVSYGYLDAAATIDAAIAKGYVTIEDAFTNGWITSEKAIDLGLDPAAISEQTEEFTIAIDDAFTSYTETLEELGIAPTTDLVTGTKEGIEAATPTLKTAIDQMGAEAVKEILVTMSAAEGYTLGFDYVQGVINGVNAQIDGITGAGSTIGASFADGLVAGMNSKYDLVVAAAQALGAAMLSATGGEIEVGSPSRKARDEIGAMYDMGIVEGLYGEMRSVTQAAREVGNAMHNEFLIGDPSHGARAGAARQTADALVSAAQDSGLIAGNSEKASMINSLANALDKRPLYLVQDGRIVARLNADYNAQAANARNQQIALGYGK